MAAILRVRDNDGNIIEIPAIKGEKGDKGDIGVIVGSYVGDGSVSSRYINLGATNVVAVLVGVTDIVDGHPGSAFISKENGAKINGYSALAIIESGPYPTNSIGIYYNGTEGRAYFNESGVTYTYIAFTSGE